MRYYSTQRPVMPGSYPKTAPVKEIRNFDRRTYCQEIGRPAWGWIDYEGALDPKTAASYELVPERNAT